MECFVEQNGLPNKTGMYITLNEHQWYNYFYYAHNGNWYHSEDIFKQYPHKTISGISKWFCPANLQTHSGYSREQIEDAFEAGFNRGIDQTNVLQFIEGQIYPDKETYLNSITPPENKDVEDAVDMVGEILDWADNAGWVWNKSLWRKDGYKSRTTTELYNGPYKEFLNQKTQP